MVVTAGMGVYNVTAANTNRIIMFQVASGVANAFVFLNGNQPFYPNTGKIASPTVNQKIANYRVNAVVRALTIYAPVVGVSIPATTGGFASSALILTFETFQSNVFSSGINDIVDLLGLADRTAKTKPGLQTLATGVVANASLDGGGSLLFAVNPFLADGTATTAAAVAALTVTQFYP